jgi:hypothetical protein
MTVITKILDEKKHRLYIITYLKRNDVIEKIYLFVLFYQMNRCLEKYKIAFRILLFKISAAVYYDR